jgi:hypothetical protein
LIFQFNHILDLIRESLLHPNEPTTTNNNHNYTNTKHKTQTETTTTIANNVLGRTSASGGSDCVYNSQG